MEVGRKKVYLQFGGQNYICKRGEDQSKILYIYIYDTKLDNRHSMLYQNSKQNQENPKRKKEKII